VRITHEGTNHQFDAEDVRMITEARVDELFEFVDKELKRVHRSRKLPGGVILVGGTAKLPGIASFAKDRLQLASRIGALQPMTGLVDTVQDTSYATAVGLMMLDMLLVSSDGGSDTGEPSQKVFGLVEGVLKRFRR
jgi:cell division protein FtsA